MNAELFDSSTMEGKFRFQSLRKDRIKGIYLRFLYWWVEQLLDSIGRGRISWNELNYIKLVGTFVSKSWIRHAIDTSATWKPVPFPVNNWLPDFQWRPLASLKSVSTEPELSTNCDSLKKAIPFHFHFTNLEFDNEHVSVSKTVSA